MVLFIPAFIYQVSAYEALRVGAFDGTFRVSDLTKHGDFGLGTFNGLDGEMVVLAGKVYQVTGYGDAKPPAVGVKTPFAFVTHFHPKSTIYVSAEMTSGAIQAAIDKHFPTGILAIKIHGSFDGMLARSFAPQQKPYQPLAKIMDRQSIFPYGKIEGDLVGFRMPKDVGTFNVPGYHFHFISSDRKRGGHVLKFGIRMATVQVMPVDRINK